MNDKDTYQTIVAPAEGLFKEKGSKFIAFAYPIESEDKAKMIITDLRKKYFDARHHCFAYKLGIDNILYRIYDDGEPSGTAGKPIYGQIQSFNLTNVLILVVRYFGGKLLGTGGLINAYKHAAEDALLHAKIENRIISYKADLYFNHKEISDIMRLLNNFGCAISEQNFNEICHLTVKIKRSLISEFKSKLEGFKSLKLVIDENS